MKRFSIIVWVPFVIFLLALFVKGCHQQRAKTIAIIEKNTLRDGGEKVNELLEEELNERLAPAGIIIKEARISHLAYASEIAHAMLQRQQATAIVAARFKIVEGAVGMVELALEMLSKKQIVQLDEEKKAAMVSNLMVVLCGEKGTTPIVNTGTLYQ